MRHLCLHFLIPWFQTAAYTPSGVLVLAGSLANCPPGKWFSRETRKTILAVGMARWLLLPLVTSGGERRERRHIPDETETWFRSTYSSTCFLFFGTTQGPVNATSKLERVG